MLKRINASNKVLQVTFIIYFVLSLTTPFLVIWINSYYLQPEYYFNTLGSLLLILILVWTADTKVITLKSFITPPIIVCLVIALNIVLHGLFKEQFYNFIYITAVALLWVIVSNCVTKPTVERLEMPIIVLFSVVLGGHLIMAVLNWQSGHLSNRRILNNYGQFSNYIALFFPLLVSIFFFKAASSTFERFIKAVSLVLSLIVLVILIFNNVRTAWLPSILLLLGCLFKDKVINIQNKYHAINQTNRYKIALIAFALLLSVVLFSYFLKRDSADGRLFIWQIAWTIFLDHPLTGVGFNQFPCYYNIYQADYFRTHNDPAYAWLAADVFFAFNEILQSMVELGIVAVGLWAFVGYRTIKILRGLFFNWQVHPSKQWLSVGFLGFIIILAFQIFFSYPFKDQSSTHTIFIMNLFYRAAIFAK